MTSPETEEKLRKLASIEANKADLSWLFYLSGEGEERPDNEQPRRLGLFHLRYQLAGVPIADESGSHCVQVSKNWLDGLRRNSYKAIERIFISRNS